MNLSNIRAPKKANENKKRVGRGMGSGMGKTSTRGHKGQRSRSGSRMMRGFEGGQMPLHRRMPKRGFNNIFSLDFAQVGLGRIQKAIDQKRLDRSAKITEEVLRHAGLARRSRHGVRLLGGMLKAKIDIEAAGASASAVEQIKNAGGSVCLTFKKPVHNNKKGEPGKKAQRRAKSAEKRAARQ